MAFPVVVDACILVSMPKADLILRLADRGRFRVLWSEEILDEVERNLVTAIGLSPPAAGRTGFGPIVLTPPSYRTPRTQGDSTESLVFRGARGS